MERGHKVAALLHAPVWSPGQTQPQESLFLGCQGECGVGEEMPRGCVSFILPLLSLHPKEKSQPPVKPLSRGCCHLKLVPSSLTRTHPGDLLAFASSSSPEVPPVVGCPGRHVASEEPACIWRLWSHPEGTRPYKSKGRCFDGT